MQPGSTNWLACNLGRPTQLHKRSPRAPGPTSRCAPTVPNEPSPPGQREARRACCPRGVRARGRRRVTAQPWRPGHPPWRAALLDTPIVYPAATSHTDATECPLPPRSPHKLLHRAAMRLRRAAMHLNHCRRAPPCTLPHAQRCVLSRTPPVSRAVASPHTTCPKASAC